MQLIYQNKIICIFGCSLLFFYETFVDEGVLKCTDFESIIKGKEIEGLFNSEETDE